MTTRFASLASVAWLLVATSSCGSLDVAGFESPTKGDDAGAAGSSRDPDAGGAGGSNATGFGGSGGTGGTGNGTAGAAGGTVPSGEGGDSGVGAGGTDDGPGGSVAVCPKDTNASNAIDCDDEGQKCECPDGQACDAVCTGAQRLYAGLTCRDFILAGRKSSKQPACSPQPELGPSMAFAIDATAAGWVRVKVTPKQGDVILSATTGECEQATQASKTNVCRNDTGKGGVETVLLPVTSGQRVTLLVTGATEQDASARFDVETTFVPPSCGNGLIDEGEACDDGGETKACKADCSSFVGCTGATALADAVDTTQGASEAGDALAGGLGAPLSSCVTVGAQVQRTIYALRAANTGRLEARLTSSDGHDLALSVRSSCEAGQELGCSDRQGPVSKAATEERLSLPVTAGQTYFLLVEGYGASDASYTLSARTLPVDCGDGVVVPSVEQCDPGGLTPDATCEAACTRKSAAGEDAKAPVTIAVGGEAEARIAPASDVDEYMLKADAPVSVSVADMNGSDCAERRLDSQLTVLNLQGQVVAFNDDAEAGGSVQGYCSEVTLPKGSYRVRVRSSEASAPAQVFSYRVRVAAAP